jgi:hypothetical protein
MGYRPAGVIIRTSLHDHGGECDRESDQAWSDFLGVVEEAMKVFLDSRCTWIEHSDCQCASCEEEEKDV